MKPRQYIALICLLGGAAPVPSSTTGADLTAGQYLERALAAHGTSPQGVVRIRLHGQFDLSTRLQGRTLDPEPTPIEEHIAIDMDGRRVAYDVRWHNYYYSVQDLREIHDAENRILFIDKRNENGGWMPGALVPDARERYARHWPQALLAEAASRPKTLVMHEAMGTGDDRANVISFATAAGERITLYIDATDHLLRGASAMLDMPLLGDTEIMWAWSSYSRVGNLQVPGRLRTWLGSQLLKDVHYSIDTQVDQAVFATPPGIEVAAPPEPRSMDDWTPPSKRPADVETISDGVYLVRNLRPGFNMMFVEFDEFVVAVDAPSGWYEMQQIPPMNWSHGDSSSALSEKYLRAIAAAVPDKPLRYVVLTHHHSDHIGGVRAFIAAGATVIAATPAATLARRAARSRFSIGADALSGREDAAIDIEIVPGDYTISDGEMEMRLLELPDGNPKADGYLMVYLPRQRLLYTTAFIYPVPEAVFPPLESLDLSLYFVDWLDKSDLDIETIYNVHGMAKVETWQLQRLRDLAVDHVPAWRR